MPIRTTYKYPLDLMGTSPTNKVVGEKHVIGTSRARIFIAESGPFFGGDKIVVRDSSNGEVLRPVLDYYLVHPYREAQEITGQPVYCGVRIINPDIGTDIEIDVQYIGGEFSYTTRALLDMLDSIINDNRPIDWGDLIGVPNEWVPTPHLHSAYDLYAMKHMVAATNDVASAIREGMAPAHAHLFEMINGRIEVFERVVPSLVDCYDEGKALLASIIGPDEELDPIGPEIIDLDSIPGLPASKIDSGVFAVARIPVLNQNTTGNAATATRATTADRLTTARNIGGVSFNGSANINLPGVNQAGNQNTSGNAGTATKLLTARSVRVGNATRNFDGTANISWTLAEIGAAPSAHTHTVAQVSGLQDVIDTKVNVSGNQTIGGTKDFTGVLRATGTANATSSSTGSLRSSGGLGVALNIFAGGNVTGYSDIRKKKDIVAIDNALCKVLSLRGVYYTRKDSGSKELGWIAQEMQQIEPRLVGGDEETGLGIHYGNGVALVSEAVKQLFNEVIMPLRAKVKELEAIIKGQSTNS